jgi:hypothetical protein
MIPEGIENNNSDKSYARNSASGYSIAQPNLAPPIMSEHTFDVIPQHNTLLYAGDDDDDDKPQVVVVGARFNVETVPGACWKSICTSQFRVDSI